MAQENKKDILQASIAREIDILEVYMFGTSARTAVTLQEYIDARLLSGADPDIIKDELLTDLKEGGRIFGEFRNSMKSNARGHISRARDCSEFSELGVKGSYRWSAVLINTCPDCMDRHGEEKTWEEWEDEGMPRTGATVCKENCKCVLLPAEVAVLAPIKRPRRVTKAMAKMSED
jgi:hypothetical protein